MRGTGDAVITVALLLFDDVEVLDACGPFEVFATTRLPSGDAAFRVVTVSDGGGVIRAVGGLRMMADHSLEDCPPHTVLIVPGGVGRKRECENPRVIEWIRTSTAEIILSVCTGAFLLGRARLLDGLAVTTHFSALDELEGAHPEASARRGVRFVDNGRIVTAAGISAGIDASLHLVGRLVGAAPAQTTARRMEYSWST